ncbi:Deoxyribodipyrimidine photo-lyase OS=Tsukamurella paurometabola (strain ATCC 8368 / DSM / CCUG 35730 / CIP 100753 / JCM 10117 / KCTC 9821 / NBRC 16120 /NCIMB 702349 / NCTC 13040) OX=521096 GN=Tpau_3030 PE=3 SV=1 [Tsukamurella paurometabola]|uniref:Deoxyribodipyrimidine photo-lyase n=1 Tax=Tsukamurella paurometabola (strain ATCC 8368 / DSM 20162 / CCUG 35730 / CIP 100753 / JCM 10117 / KCTC 9821 / NBRC 16120 / NCIMB 702349 / NCTC 13040) TaxID=521096 RepID=D5UUQ6_TSUPD|nr:deoxyribodipyrimidine photo-lyase [Tsukamurella paurometabola]ADG79624.1 Deoxyribodipyrimidine photo-lyase [Tsukamurella paurometabola DSM 20162]SUP36493.1 Deoxyribodipyrimidine photo-lyase [Tsukamurella paurometabola]
MTVIWWARRDLRLGDNPALCAAAAAGPVLPLVVLDPALLHDGARPREAWYAANVLALDDQLGGELCLRSGSPVEEVLAVALETGATAVHVSRETTPFGSRRDASIRDRLAEHGIDWVETGSPYAVTPGRIVKSDGTPYRVFGAFQRAWREHRWPAPAQLPDRVHWARPPAGGAAERRSLAAMVEASPVPLPPAGESAALDRWHRFRTDELARYAQDRDRPDHDASSRLSPYLKVGAVHPRTLLTGLGSSDGAAKYASELCWRDFYADVLYHHPDSLRTDLTKALAGLEYTPPGADFTAWQRGATGYPLVDAGMRQLRTEGWMHNRVRMVVASFLSKDLHVWWPHGAAHFLDLLLDGDPASNAHGWQWVAGTGTDAAPYFRVFNPTTQAEKFDPRGDYVRRYVPELRHLDGAAALAPWKHTDGYAHGYPAPIVDHAEERAVTLARYGTVRGK